MDLEAGARRVAAILRDAGYEAYFAGGCVRDLLLGLSPKDFDIATNALPDQIAELFRRTVFIGAAFGVVQVRMGGHGYEVATYRRDGNYVDGRRPSVVHYSSSKEEDVERRDFTINALLMDPETHEVIDLVGGQQDIRARRIRAVGHPEDRFREDRLRMLRAVRFATRFDFEIEAETAEAIRAQAEFLREVSAERVLAELEGIFESEHPDRGLRRLDDLGLGPAALPFLPDDEAVRRATYDAVERARLPEQPRSERSPLAFALLFGDADPERAEEALRRLKAPRKPMKTVTELLRARPVLQRPDAERPAALARLAVDGSPERVLAYARGRGFDAAADRIEAYRRDREADPLPPRPVVGGADLASRGLPPGPRFKELLREVDDRVLERRIRDRDEALAWLDETLAS